VRLILFLVTIQFLCPAAPAECGDFNTRHPQIIQTHHAKSFSLALLFEENTTERESEDEVEKFSHCHEIIDFSFVETLLKKYHTPNHVIFINDERFTLKPALFKLHKIFLI
jgi:hypothetical protein